MVANRRHASEQYHPRHMEQMPMETRDLYTAGSVLAPYAANDTHLNNRKHGSVKQCDSVGCDALCAMRSNLTVQNGH